MESWLQNCLYSVQGHYLHIENQATGKTRAMSRTLCMSCQLNCGMLTPSLAELEIYRSSSKSAHYPLNAGSDNITYNHI